MGYRCSISDAVSDDELGKRRAQRVERVPSRPACEKLLTRSAANVISADLWRTSDRAASL